MYFTKTLAAFVALTVFATSTIAAPTKAPPVKAPVASGPLVAGSGIFAKIKPPQTAWDKVAQLCASGKNAKRDFDDDFDLEARSPPPGFMNVEMGKFDSYPSDMHVGLWTEGLVTCIGVAVTGTAPAANPKAHVRFLLHTTTSKVQVGWDEFEKKLRAQNLQNMHGWISKPDLTHSLPQGWTNDLKILVEQMSSATEDKLRAIIGRDPEVNSHPMVPASTMGLDKDGHVTVNGEQI